MSEIYFYKGKENILDVSDEESNIQKIKAELSKVFDTKSLSFLIGSGCSSFYDDELKKEIGIPTMKFLAEEFYKPTSSSDSLSNDDVLFLKYKLCIDLQSDEIKSNIERFLDSLYSLYYYVNKTQTPTRTSFSGHKIDEHIAEVKVRLPLLITKTQHFILKKCLNELNRELEFDAVLIKLYETFYRKLLYRNPNLPKPNIFTTNYDLYSETALDNIGILYTNGFSGGINKYFNPTIFNYAFAEKMDLSQNKWNVIDNFIYLYKIHGSINWIEDKLASNKLFKIKEIQDPTFDNLKSKESIMIYPTPIKQNASLGSPYADLFREFQKKLMQNNNVLITMGYSFGDEHINNLIYQAFTIPSFRLIAFIEKGDKAEKLIELDDPRIWIIGGKMSDDKQLHFFSQIVSQLLPDLTNDEIDEKIENAIKKLMS